MQSNPLLERIFAAVEGEETKGRASDWRQRIEAASAKEKETVMAQAIREIVGSVLRVKPDTLRDDQPLTDLGLDSLMGVEIENSLEAAIGVALPPTSLMRARTIGQMATLIAGHISGGASTTTSPIAAPTPARTPSSTEEPLASVEVDLDALSGEEIDRLIGDSEDPLLEAISHV
jgi:acyl carrier protein